jgi:hypothetical protein
VIRNVAVQIAKLSTVATLDSTQFGSGIARMTTSIGAFSGIALGAFNRIGAGVVNMTQRVLTALPRMTVASIRAGDDLGDLATELGFTTEALSTLARVAGLAGIEIGGVQSMVGNMNNMLGEAQQGNEAAIKSFTDLGLSFERLSKQSPDDAFFDVLEAMRKLPNVARQTAASMDIFKKGGRQALRLMGTDWEAERLNTGRLGLAGRGGDVAALGSASDTLDDLKNNLKGFSDQLAIKLAPAVTAVGQDFLDFSKKTTLAANAADFFATGMKTAALTIAASLDTMRNAVPFGLLGGGKSYTDQLYESLNKANQPEAPPASVAPIAPAGRKPGKPWANTGGYGPKEMARRNALEESRQGRIKFLQSEQDRVTAEIAAGGRPNPGGWWERGKANPAQEKYLAEILAELKKLNSKGSTGGARP